MDKNLLQQEDNFYEADFLECKRPAGLSEQGVSGLLPPGVPRLSLPSGDKDGPAEKKGYSGTAVFTPHQPVAVAYGMDKDRHDHEGRLITLEYDQFYLVCCYTPNAQDGLKRLDYRMAWEDDLREYLMSLDKTKPVIYCGDLNVAHEEIDLKNPKTNRKNAGFSDQEREKMTTLLASGFTDSFRYLYPDVTGAYSWWSYRFHARQNNAGWRIDYFIVSDRLRDKIRRAEILSDVEGSDHCPVLLDIELD